MKTTWNILSETLNVNSKSNGIVPDLNANEINDYFIDKVDEIVTNISSKHDAMYFFEKLDKTRNVFVFKHVKVEDIYATTVY